MADQLHFGDVNYNEIAARSQQLTLDIAGKLFVLHGERQSSMFDKTAVELDPAQAKAIAETLGKKGT